MSQKTKDISLSPTDLDVCQAQHALDPTQLSELVDSLRVNGQMHRVHVRKVGKRYEVISGRRRTLALAELGLPVLCTVHEECTDRQAASLRLAENVARQDPTAFDVAKQIRERRNQTGLSYEELAKDLGMHISRIKQYMCVFGGSTELLDAMEQS